MDSFSRAGGDCSLLAPNSPCPFEVDDGFPSLFSPSSKDSSCGKGSGGGAKGCPPPKVGYTDLGRNPIGFSTSVFRADPGLWGGNSSGDLGASSEERE